MAEQKEYDVVIVGAGPGGLCAGLYSARARGGQIVNTEEVEDYLGFEHISGAELSMKFAEHAKSFGLEIESEQVEEVYSDGDYKIARCASGNIYRARAVIVPGVLRLNWGCPVRRNMPVKAFPIAPFATELSSKTK